MPEARTGHTGMGRLMGLPLALARLAPHLHLALKQGRKTVTEYLYEFNHLARYAPAEVATDEAKQEKFAEGLSDSLQEKLALDDFPDFQTLVDKVIILEHKGQVLGESRKRKWETHKSSHTSDARPRFGKSTREIGRAHV